METTLAPMIKEFLQLDFQVNDTEFEQIFEQAENLKKIVENDWKQGLILINKNIDDKIHLVFICMFHRRSCDVLDNPFALGDNEELAVIKALHQITDERLLFFVARYCRYTRLRWEAVLMINNQDLLFQLVISEQTEWIVETIISKIDDLELLSSLLLLSKYSALVRDRINN